MVAEKIAETDEEIIDLTELIEKGEAPAAVVPPAEGTKEDISVHMQSLNDGQARQGDAEIDALLAQMEAGDEQPVPPPPAARAAAPEHKVDPHEELDMSGMVEVDKLLDTLDIPPQPHERGPDAAQDADPGDLDNAVDDLLNAMSGSAPRKPASESAQEPDVHDLLAAASPQPEEPNFADDLDALLASAEAPAPAEASAPAPQARENPDLTADLDSLLAGLDAEQAQPATAESALGQPAASPAASEPAPEKEPDLEMDLDALLASVDAPASPQPTKRSGSGECDACIDLDKLLAPAGAEATPDPAPEAPASPTPSPDPAPEPSADQSNPPTGLDAEQDAAATAEPEQARPSTPSTAADHMPEDVAPEAAPDLETDLDALLAVMSPDQDMSPAPAAGDAEEAGKTDAARSPLEAEALEPEPALPADSMENLPQAEEAPDLPAVDENPAAEERPESEPELDLDKLLRSAMQEEADASATPFAASEGTEQPETEPAVVADVPAVEDLLLMPASEEDSRMEQAARTADIPADPAALRELTELTEQAARLDERLQRCESELAEARARVAALEKAAAAPSASLEDLLREGNPLHDRFAALIASSVSQALKAMPSGVTDAVLEERLQSVSLLGKSVSARMDALESRLDTLEPRFNQQVEKAAAGAAARILREEIAKLIQG
ncbi:hypothetical protein [uncultured Desulfovibrio sp.]|uniref:hypothetical protein n=1 Tax=uncultured Desulfovibrio sp. TaxID=167968 RepID=UPI002671F641|nr:hypothetical protein [uncultured Desulfovibrio sp.]